MTSNTQISSISKKKENLAGETNEHGEAVPGHHGHLLFPAHLSSHLHVLHVPEVWLRIEI